MTIDKELKTQYQNFIEQNDPNFVVQFLENPDPKIREICIRSIAELIENDPDSVWPLLQQLKQDNINRLIADQAIRRQLMELAEEDPIFFLPYLGIDVLDSVVKLLPNVHAVMALAAFRGADTFPHIAAIFQDQIRQGRLSTDMLKAFAALADPRCFDLLLDACACMEVDEGSSTVKGSLPVLAAIFGTLKAIQDQTPLDPKNEKIVVRLSGLFPGHSLESALDNFLQDPDPRLRAAIWRSFEAYVVEENGGFRKTSDVVRTYPFIPKFREVFNVLGEQEAFDHWFVENDRRLASWY